MNSISPTPRLDPIILPIVTAALDAGFHIYAPKKTDRRPSGFVCVALDPAGSYAHIQKPTHPWDGPQLDAPIKPSRDYGSAVGIDFDGTTEGAIAALRKVCESPTVTVRFVGKRGQAAPVVPNHGRKTIWSEDSFEELTSTDLNTVGN